MDERKREKMQGKKKTVFFCDEKKTNNDSEGVDFHSHYDKWENTH